MHVSHAGRRGVARQRGCDVLAGSRCIGHTLGVFLNMDYRLEGVFGKSWTHSDDRPWTGIYALLRASDPVNQMYVSGNDMVSELAAAIMGLTCILYNEVGDVVKSTIRIVS